MMILGNKSSEPVDITKAFTKSEVIEITQSTPDRLVYLEKLGWVIPNRLGSKKRPTLFYTWAQVMQIKMLEVLQATHVEEGYINHVLGEISRRYNDVEFLNFNFIFYGGDVYWYSRDRELAEVIVKIKEHHFNQHPKPEVTIYSSAPIPFNKSITTGTIQMNAAYSIKHIIELLLAGAYRSKEIDFDEFKQKIDYDSFKDALELE